MIQKATRQWNASSAVCWLPIPCAAYCVLPENRPPPCRRRCCLDPKGNKAVAGFISGVLAIWDAHTGTIDTAMAVANVGVSALAFAHNGRYLIAGSADGAAVIVEMETFKVLCRLDENASGLNDVYFETGITDLSELHCVTVCSRQAVSTVGW